MIDFILNETNRYLDKQIFWRKKITFEYISFDTTSNSGGETVWEWRNGGFVIK